MSSSGSPDTRRSSDVILVSIESIIPIIALIALGCILQKRGWFQDSFGNDLSKLIQSATPALAVLPILVN